MLDASCWSLKTSSSLVYAAMVCMMVVPLVIPEVLVLPGVRWLMYVLSSGWVSLLTNSSGYSWPSGGGRCGGGGQCRVSSVLLPSRSGYPPETTSISP